MGLLRLILVISCICAGCAAPRPVVSSADGEGRPPLRMRIDDPRAAGWVAQSLLSFPRIDEAALLPADERGCERLALDGLPPDWSADRVERWTEQLARPRAVHPWLLEPVAGAGERAVQATRSVTGFEPAAGSLTACFHRSTPDWLERLRHPELWTEEGSAGDWRREVDGRFERRSPATQRKGGVDRVELVAPDDPFDLAVVHGEPAPELAGNGWVSERLPAWDMTYALWLDLEARWTNDPMFRRWLALHVERAAAARYVFGDRARPAFGLLRDGSLPAPPAVRPFASSSAPRIELAHPARDDGARRLAARIKAELGRLGVEVRLVESGSSPRPAATLFAHRARVADPLLALLDTLWPLRTTAGEELRRLERATRIPDFERRRARAGQLEADWLADGRLVPLVRLEAWSIRRRALAGVEFEAAGIVRLERAMWRR